MDERVTPLDPQRPDPRAGKGLYMSIWSFLRPRTPTSLRNIPESAHGLNLSPYVGEYLAAIDRTEAFGFDAPPRLLVKKDCIDMQTLRPVLLDFFECSPPDLLIGQTAALYFGLAPLLYDKTAMPFNLTIGWIVRNGKAIHQHDERLIQRFIEGNTDAWLEEGCPFHLWLTSPACEILDITFAMNLGWAKDREECAPLIVYQSAHEPPGDSIYHPTLVGVDFFHKTGGVL
jgi:hypothetical protein